MEIYLDNAATSHPKPNIVLNSVQNALTLYNANPGRSGHKRALEAARILLSGREMLARHFHAPDPFCFIYCFNCTDALNLAIKGSLMRGDHVISTMLEHNSVLRVLTELKVKDQIELTLLTPGPSGEVSPQAVRNALKKNTRLVAMVQASNVTGAVQPIAAVGALCKREGIRFLVDGAQSAGCMPVDVEALGCSLFAFPGHKGLLGPQGTGGLYIAPDLRLNTIREGGTGSSSDSMRQPKERPESYESGTVNMHGIAGLAAGVQYVDERLAEIMEHERALTRHMIEGLRGIGNVELYGPREIADRVGVVSFNVADLTSSIVTDALDRADIAVRGGLHCAPGVHQVLGTLKRGAVRASIGHANTHEEIDAFLKSVYDMARNGIRE